MAAEDNPHLGYGLPSHSARDMHGEDFCIIGLSEVPCPDGQMREVDEDACKEEER